MCAYLLPHLHTTQPIQLAPDIVQLFFCIAGSLYFHLSILFAPKLLLLLLLWLIVFKPYLIY